RDLKRFASWLDPEGEPYRMTLPSTEAERWAVVCDACLYGIAGYVVSFEDPARGYWYNININDDPEVWQWVLEGLGTDAPSTASTGDMSCLELVGIATGAIALEIGEGPRVKACGVTLHAFSDNTGAIGVIAAWKARSAPMRRVLSWIHEWSTRLTAQYLPGTVNRFFKVEEHLSTREVEERNVDFLAKSLRPSTMAQYETPVRLYERGHGKIRKGQEVTARNLVSFIRGLTMGGT
ncbi:hypothetical protein FOZ62_009324, partial [Perkinsus olseni]